MGIGDLTERQQAVMDLLAAGKTNREIGAALFLTEKTVKNYLSQVFAIFGVSNRTEAALIWANDRELEQPPHPEEVVRLIVEAHKAGVAEGKASVCRLSDKCGRVGMSEQRAER